MNMVKTKMPEVIIFEPQAFEGSRGFFLESYNKKIFDEAVGRSVEFVQDNHSESQRGVLRGLHCQLEPFSQGKVVRCVAGEVFDVAVDLRRSSSMFGQWEGVILSAENKRQFWIPEGFAHGFLTLSERARFLYKATNYYAPKTERCIKWDDPKLNIEWPTTNDIQLSQKDLVGKYFAEAQVYD